MHLVSVVNKQGRGYIRDRGHHDKMQRVAATCSNRQLQQSLQAGIAFHNAGMDAAERAQVEELFLQREVLVMRPYFNYAMPAIELQQGAKTDGLETLPMQAICRLPSKALHCDEDTASTGLSVFCCQHSTPDTAQKGSKGIV